MDSIEAVEILNHMYRLYIQNKINYNDFQIFFQSLPLNINLYASIGVVNVGLYNLARITFSYVEPLYGIEILNLQFPEDFDYLMGILSQKSYEYPIVSDNDIYRLRLA